MGPLFASHKTGAALLKEAAVEPAMDDESDYSTDATRNDVSSLQLSPLVEDPSSLINKYLNCSGDDSHTTPKSGNPNKLTISVSPDGDPLVGRIGHQLPTLLSSQQRTWHKLARACSLSGQCVDGGFRTLQGPFEARRR